MKDAMITPALARAARGLLDWQQSDLANIGSLSLTAIKNFEGGQKTTHKKTAQAIQNAFEKHGIEFPSSGGLRQTDDLTSVYRFSGKDFIRSLNNDIYTSVNIAKDEVLTASLGEGLWPADTSREYYAWHERTQVKVKMLVTNDTDKLFLPHKVYRVVSPEMLGKITYCLYADRLAFVIWKKKQVVVLRSALVVETFRNQFLFLWKLGRPIGK